MQECENEVSTRWAIAMRLRGKSPTAVSVIACEGDVSCTVEALKRTRCLGFFPHAFERANCVKT
jgi:hypothetical protein